MKNTNLFDESEYLRPGRTYRLLPNGGWIEVQRNGYSLPECSETITIPIPSEKEFSTLNYSQWRNLLYGRIDGEWAEESRKNAEEHAG
jgi:hypothetical protein